MRVRKKKNGDARFEACKDLYIEFDKNAPEKLDLSALFPGYTHFRAEIGCGKGSFITETARRNPDIAFIAVEKVRDVVIFASEKVKEAELPNVLFICGDAAALSAMIEPKTLETIYINFCDPWPKARHAKRRLTSEGFLKLFKELLSDDGKIEFKTDNIGLFEYSLEEFPKAGLPRVMFKRNMRKISLQKASKSTVWKVIKQKFKLFAPLCVKKEKKTLDFFKLLWYNLSRYAATDS